MDAKKFTYILLAAIVVLSTPLAVEAGQTTLSGQASCYMPERFEMRLSAEDRSRIEAPTPSGASGQYEVQETQRAPDPETMSTPQATMTTQTTTYSQMTVYTVCAK